MRLFASTPPPPYYAVILASHHPKATDEYASTAREMEQLAESQPGFLGLERVRDPAGHSLTISYWRTEAAIQAWKANSRHRAAQARGKAEWYEDYRLRVAKVTRDYTKTTSANQGLAQRSEIERAFRKGDEARIVDILKTGDGSSTNQAIHCPHLQFNNGQAILLAAAELGFAHVVDILLELGAPANMTGSLGGTALHWAAWQGFPRVVERLLQTPLSPDVTDTEYGCTPLFWAIHGYAESSDAFRRGQQDCAKKLLSSGANPKPINHLGTPATELLSHPSDGAMLRLLQSFPRR